MKKFIIMIFVFVILSQNNFMLATNFKGTKTVVSYVIPQQNPYFQWGSSGQDIGYKRGTGDPDIARTKYQFDFSSIPSNATINSVTLNCTVSDFINAYQFSIKIIGNLNPAQTIWQGISNGTTLFENVSYMSISLSNTALSNWVNNSKGTIVYLGAYSQNESNTDSYANLNITVAVEYTTEVSITADNNFTTSNGTHGQIKVDGTNQTAPFTFTKTSGQNLTLEAVSPQINNLGHQMIWCTSSCNQSDWTKGGNPRSTDMLYSFNVSADDNNKTYMANFKTTYATNSGALSANETWFTGVTLTGDVSVPSGKTLTITNCASVNLNGYSIISTGGTINKESGSSITGLAARITETGILKGLCPTIQAALTNAPSSGCFVEIQPGTYSENVSISNKSYLIITGDELNTNLTGNMSFYSCPDLQIVSIKSKNVSLSNCASADIFNEVNGSGTNGGIHLFSCTEFQREYEVSNAYCGLNANSSSGYIGPGASFYNNDIAVNAGNGSEIIMENAQICGNITTDLYAITGGYIYAYECYYNNATPRIYEYLNGNVDVSGGT